MADDPDVLAVNRQHGCLMLDSFEIIDIHTWVDADGDRTNDPDAAVSCIAQLPDGRWITVDLSKFQPAEMN